MKTIVAFHIGRGGQFNNQGHKTFNPYVKELSDCIDFSRHTIIDEDEDGNKLPDDEWVLVDGGDNVILQGRDAIECETGVLNWDNDYDTDIVQYIEDCDSEELRLLVKAYGNDDISKEALPEIVAWWDDTFDLVDRDGNYIDCCYNKKSVLRSAFNEPCKLMLGDVAIWDSEEDTREELENLFKL